MDYFQLDNRKVYGLITNILLIHYVVDIADYFLRPRSRYDAVISQITGGVCTGGWGIQGAPRLRQTVLAHYGGNLSFQKRSGMRSFLKDN